MAAALQIAGLEVRIGDKEILRGLDLEVPFGEIHAIMGPNGSGKSTLCHVLSGKTGYEVAGLATLAGADLLSMDVDERAREGLILGFQYPIEVPGVSLRVLMEEALDERGVTGNERITVEAERFDTTRFLERSVNDDLSGGEKKRSEIFQMAVLEPKVALLDEIDSGLDIDAVREVSEAVEAMRSPDIAIVMITHYSRILRYLSPDKIHVMMDGRIITSGGPELAEELETGGYEAIRTRLGIEKRAETVEKRPSDFFTDTPFDV
ncbi:MAG: Fe-S cluster assembly ATPase SufC [Acidimicrobiia bacterium]|nr:Fe-S cluster assembly ATPase SufC [Acidimicrobiia bacterium]